jgi:nucleotide-binding universal stress UspA family protein
MTNQNVVACIDGSRSTAAVCDYAAWASTTLAAPLVLLHVLEESRYAIHSDLSGNIGLGSREYLLKELAELDEKRARLLREQGRLMLDAALERTRAAGVVEPVSRQRHGELVATLNELEEEMRLLVIGRQGADGDSLGQHVGSHVESVARTMHRPVLVIAGEYRPLRSVMLAFDNGPSTRKGIEMIADSPLFRGLPIHLVTVGADTGDTRESLEQAQARLERAGFEVHTSIRLVR